MEVSSYFSEYAFLNIFACHACCVCSIIQVINKGSTAGKGLVLFGITVETLPCERNEAHWWQRQKRWREEWRKLRKWTGVLSTGGAPVSWRHLFSHSLNNKVCPLINATECLLCRHGQESDVLRVFRSAENRFRSYQCVQRWKMCPVEVKAEKVSVSKWWWGAEQSAVTSNKTCQNQSSQLHCNDGTLPGIDLPPHTLAGVRHALSNFRVVKSNLKPSFWDNAAKLCAVYTLRWAPDTTHWAACSVLPHSHLKDWFEVSQPAQLCIRDEWRHDLMFSRVKHLAISWFCKQHLYTLSIKGREQWLSHKYDFTEDILLGCFKYNCLHLFYFLSIWTCWDMFTSHITIITCNNSCSYRDVAGCDCEYL